MNRKVIEHDGIVKEVGEQFIRVSLISASACAGCHARGACSAADLEIKEIDVVKEPGFLGKAGDPVNVVMQHTMGFKALWYGYLFPLLLLVLAMIIFSGLFENEALAGLVALTVLVPYYLIIALLKNRLQKMFVFRLKPSF